jgi:hypothetical protein
MKSAAHLMSISAKTDLGSPLERKIFARMSIVTGNVLQVAGILGACVSLIAARTSARSGLAAASMVAAWILLYFFAHGIAHWVVGRLLGIRFRFYTVGGTGNPEEYPPGVRWLFEHLPFFGVQTEKASMESASGAARAIMWSAGVSSSAIVPTLSALVAWRWRVLGSGLFFVFAVVWGLATLASNWTSRSGDFAKARRSLRG